MSSITCHTLSGFKTTFMFTHRRMPTDQEIFDAGMRAGRDLKWPDQPRPTPPTQESCGQGNTGCPVEPQATTYRVVNTTGDVRALNTPEHLKRADGDYLRP